MIGAGEGCLRRLATVFWDRCCRLCILPARDCNIDGSDIMLSTVMWLYICDMLTRFAELTRHMKSNHAKHLHKFNCHGPLEQGISHSFSDPGHCKGRA